MSVVIFKKVLWCNLLVLLQNFCPFTESSTVGIVFGDNTAQIQTLINTTIDRKSERREIIFFSNIQHVSPHDSYETSVTMCKMMKNGSGIAAIFGPDSGTSTTILESISTEFQIPYIVTSWRSPALKPSRFLLNFFPEANGFAHGLAEIVKSFGWKSFVIVYEEDDALLRMQEILKMQKFNENDRTNKIVLEKLGHGPDFRMTLSKIKRSTVTNIILDCGTKHIMSILYQAKTMNMLNVYNNFFVTNLDAHTLDYSELRTTANITTIRIFDDNSEFLKNYVRRMELGELVHYKKLKTELVLFYDAFWFLNDTISELGPAMMTSSIDCNGSEKSLEGRNMINYMKTRSPTTSTLSGPLTFDNFGNRILFNIYVADILHEKKIATWYAYNQSLSVNRDFDETLTAVSNLQGTKVIVVSKLGKPYLMLKDNADEDELEGNARFEGYSMDLIANIAKIIGFEFEMQLTETNTYGYWDGVNERWTGLIGDILYKKAHLGVGDLTITPERQEVVDFSLPFMTLGISILHRKQNTGSPDMFAFLKPFTMEVWNYLIYMVLLVSAVHYIILRISSDDWDTTNVSEGFDETQENIWNLKNTIWNVIRSVTTQSSDRAPKGVSARIAVAIWWFFCLIITSIYIANLSVFATQANIDSSINSVEDLAKQSRVKYGLIKGGSTETFFRHSNFSTYQRMWSSMMQNPSVFQAENAEGVERVILSNNARYAFFMESSQLEYEMERNCDLKQIGDLLDSKSYGIAMPMNSPYRGVINKAILKMQESGQLAELKNKWWRVKEEEESFCESNNGDGSSDSKLPLEDIQGIFLILGFGIIISLVLALIEFFWSVRKIANAEDMYFSDVLKEELQFATHVCTIRRKVRTSAVE